MRTVYPPSMVAHLWANRTQDHARTSGSTLYFDGDTIYSYGSHFPIAKHVEHKGKRAVLFTTRSYSITTSSHCSEVRSSIPDEIPVFHVPSRGVRWEGIDHAENLKSYADRMEKHGKALANPRTQNRSWRESDILNLKGERNAYAKFFGLRVKPITGDVSTIVQECQADRERIEAAEKRRRLAADRKARKELAERIEQWKNGERVSIGHAPDTYLRIKGDDIETSLGAVVPVSDARKVFPIIQRCRQNGTEWHRNGEVIRIGDFHFDRIEPTGDIKVGCHRIGWSEVERIAKLLNLV